jgi:hypothetical protein
MPVTKLCICGWRLRIALGIIRDARAEYDFSKVCQEENQSLFTGERCAGWREYAIWDSPSSTIFTSASPCKHSRLDTTFAPSAKSTAPTVYG